MVKISTKQSNLHALFEMQAQNKLYVTEIALRGKGARNVKKKWRRLNCCSE